MVKFLISITGEGNLKFEEGKTYEAVVDSTVPELKDFILVKQSDSPKGKDLYCKIARSHESKIFEYVK